MVQGFDWNFGMFVVGSDFFIFYFLFFIFSCPDCLFVLFGFRDKGRKNKEKKIQILSLRN